jgi:hypothetical protein
MSSGTGPPGCGISGGIGSVLGSGGTGGGSRVGADRNINSRFPKKGMPADRRASLPPQDEWLFVVPLPLLTGLLARLLVGLLLLTLLLLVLLALALLLVAVLLGLLRVAVLRIVHCSPSILWRRRPM